MPTICMLRCYSPLIPMADIFPASHHPGEVVQECQEITRSLIEFPKRYFPGRECNITFDLFGITKENINLIGEVMEGMATCIQSYSSFPDIRFLEFRTDDTTIRVRSRLSSSTQLFYSKCSHGAPPDSLKPYRYSKMSKILFSYFPA